MAILLSKLSGIWMVCYTLLYRSGQEERKMTREGFAANNRGIAAGGNLEESFLNEIFDHIRANPISLKEDDTARERAGEVTLMIEGG